jgi:hypothetical protein
MVGIIRSLILLSKKIDSAGLTGPSEPPSTASSAPPGRTS